MRIKKIHDRKKVVTGVMMALSLLVGCFQTPVSIKAADNSEPAEAVVGDTNGDGNTDIADALLISRYDAGLIDLSEEQLQESDVNVDDSVDIADALLISRYDAGLIELDKKGSNRRLFYRYVGETLVPKYGLAELNQSGTMTNSSTAWLQPRGIYSAEISDLDGDGQEEMLVVSYQYVEKGKYSMLLEIYESDGKSVTLADSMSHGSYFENEQTGKKVYCGVELYANQQVDETVNISLVETELGQYIICENQAIAHTFGDGKVQNYWAVRYDGKRLVYEAAFLQTAGESNGFEFTGYDFENGKCIGDKLLWAQIPEYASVQPLYEDFTDALTSYFGKNGVIVKKAENGYFGESILAENNSMTNVTTIKSRETSHDYNQSTYDFLFDAQDYTDMRSKITVKDAWVNAYTQQLYKLQDEKTNTIRFELGYVDEDEVPELFVHSNLPSHASDFSVYTYVNNHMIYLGKFVAFSECYYSVRNGMIVTYDLNYGHEVYIFIN